MHMQKLTCFLILSWVARFSFAEGLLPVETGLGWEDGWIAEWHEHIPGLEVRDVTTRISPKLTKIVRRWTWKGTAPLEKVVLSVRYRITGNPRDWKPYLPGILHYGNPSNAGRTDGKVPVYAGEPGEFAQFEEHRLPMPFALLENSQTRSFAALHTLPSSIEGAKRQDLWWSLGVEAHENGADLVLLSGPVGYNRRRSVVKAKQREAMAYDDAYMTLNPGQVVEKTFWIEEGQATPEAFGFQQALSVSLDLFRPYDASQETPFAEILRMKRDYALTRWVDDPAKGYCGFRKYDINYPRRHITLGWCGCAATCGYALPVLDMAPEDWSKAQRSLDFLADTFLGTINPTTGIFCVCYDFGTQETSGGDPVSCGQSLYSFLKAIRFAEKHPGRLNTSKWRAFAQAACVTLANAVLRDNWVEPKSTAEGFMVAPLVVASELFAEPRCLAAAEKIANLFARKYHSYDAVYWGGTLDASCEDKEGAYAAFQGYLELLRHAHEKGTDAAAERRWATLARHAMDMMLTYTMVWNATYPPGRRLADKAFRSCGWTVVSAQNQHLDAFGVLTTPEIWRMGVYLKDRRLQDLARVMYRSCFQLTDVSGSLGEQIQQTNFAQRGDMSDVRTFRGGYVDSWTVFWLTAHFLNAGAQFREMSVEL
jgi:hypothetical protein